MKIMRHIFADDQYIYIYIFIFAELFFANLFPTVSNECKLTYLFFTINRAASSNSGGMGASGCTLNLISSPEPKQFPLRSRTSSCSKEKLQGKIFNSLLLKCKHFNVRSCPKVLGRNDTWFPSSFKVCTFFKCAKVMGRYLMWLFVISRSVIRFAVSPVHIHDGIRSNKLFIRLILRSVCNESNESHSEESLLSLRSRTLKNDNFKMRMSNFFSAQLIWRFSRVVGNDSRTGYSVFARILIVVFGLSRSHSFSLILLSRFTSSDTSLPVKASLRISRNFFKLSTGA